MNPVRSLSVRNRDMQNRYRSNGQAGMKHAQKESANTFFLPKTFNGVSPVRHSSFSALSHVLLSLLLFSFFAILVAPYFVHATEPCTTAFCPLTGVEEVRGSKLATLYDSDRDLVGYLNTLFKMAISAGAIIALLRLLYAGYTYMASDIWTSKETAKGIFREVFLGLFLLLSIYIILKQINPNLLNLDVRLRPVTPTTAPAPAPGATSSGTSGCSLCVPIPSSVRSKPPGTVPGSSACRAYGGPCVVSPTMASKLQALSAISLPMAWQVTEAYPPTVPHGGPTSCHNNNIGTCVDANIINGADKTPYNINQFMGAASRAGLTAKWEVADQARKDQLIGLGVPGSSILVTGYAEHFHITGG